MTAAMTQPEAIENVSTPLMQSAQSAQSESALGENVGDQILNVPNTITLIRIGTVPFLLFMPLMLGELGSQIMA